MLNNTNEQWLPVQGFEGLYEVSSHGRVRNNRKVMKVYVINSGYACLKLVKDGVRTSVLVHRLVAQAFCTKSEDAIEVNHIDGNKSNNAASNLEWCSSSQNTQHALTLGLYEAIYHTKNSLGKKHLPNTHSNYHNVSFDRNRGKWTACIRSNGRNLGHKRFDTEIEAALHVNWIIDHYQLTDRPKNIISI